MPMYLNNLSILTRYLIYLNGKGVNAWTYTLKFNIVLFITHVVQHVDLHDNGRIWYKNQNIKLQSYLQHIFLTYQFQIG